MVHRALWVRGSAPWHKASNVSRHLLTNEFGRGLARSLNMVLLSSRSAHWTVQCLIPSHNTVCYEKLLFRAAMTDKRPTPDGLLLNGVSLSRPVPIFVETAQQWALSTSWKKSMRRGWPTWKLGRCSLSLDQKSRSKSYYCSEFYCMLHSRCVTRTAWTHI